MIRRAELLIAPWDAVPADPEETARCLACSLKAPQFELRTTGSGHAVLFAYEGQADAAVTSDGGDWSITEGHWPEPVGLRLSVSSEPADPSWTVEVDHYGLRPLYFGLDRRRQPVVSTRPEMVAALIGSRLSAQALAEQLLVGYNLENHCVFEDVFRLRPQMRLSYEQWRGFRVTPTQSEATSRRDAEQSPPTSEQWIEAITPTITDAFDAGHALELSGGVDSRFVLAIGLHAGVKPRLAFTLGSDDDEDVQIAQLICDRFDIDHLTLPVEIDPTRIAADAYDFVMRSGFAANACGYAWLPAAFEQLSSRRTAQIGGGGGECASGFYYGPADFLGASRALDELWVRARLFKSGVEMTEMFGRTRGRLLSADVTNTALRILREKHSTWREASDAFYLTQRVPNAGGPVLCASACWYEPLQPLLHQPHIEWTRSLTPSQRAHRRTQMRLIHQLDAALGEIRYSGGRAYARTFAAKLRQRVCRFSSAARKIRRRLADHRAAPDQGADLSADALVQNESVREAIRGLSERPELNVRREHVERMLATPRLYEHELGVLLSTAWAHQTAQSIARQLHSLTSEAPLRCAA